VLNGDRAHGLWDKTAPPAPHTRVLTSGISADVAIVGAGYAGLSAALHLAQGGANVAVLEAAGIGYGAAGRNAGLVNAGMWLLPNEFPAVLGADYGERLLEVLGSAPRVVCELIEQHDIACELERSGTLQCAVGSRGLAAIRVRAEQWMRRGANVELLDADATARKVGSPTYVGALLDRRAGTVQPLAYARGLAKAAISAGVHLYTSSPALAVEQVATSWRLRTPNGTVDAPWVIVATDAYTVGPWPQIQSELTHLPYFNVATRPLSEPLRKSILPEKQGMTDTRIVLSSIRFDRSGRLIIGSIGTLRGTGVSVHTAWAKRAIRKVFPQIGEIDLDYAWYGSIGMTASRLPSYHHLAPRVLTISGYNGRGIAAATVFGRLLAQLILGQTTERELPLPRTEPQRVKFRSLRSRCYSMGAGAAHFVGARI
jgi:L-pipecolate oxidase